MTRRKLSIGLVALALWATLAVVLPAAATAAGPGVAAGADCPGCAVSIQADAANGSDRNPLGFMTADATRESATMFRVTVRNAGLARSADVATPPGVGAAADGELRGLSVRSKGAPSSFTLRFAAAGSIENLSAAARGRLLRPVTLDRPLLYLNATANAPAGSFTVTHRFDVGRDDLREDGATPDDIRVLAFYDGRWRTLGNTTQSPDGSEQIVKATTSGTVPLVFGYQRPELTVTNVSQAGRLYANRTGSIRATVHNRGHTGGSQTFDIETRNDTILSNHTIYAEAGRQRTVSVPVRFPGPGEWPVEIDDGETTVRVEQPRPNLVVSNVSLSSDRIAPGDAVTLTATVTNVGLADGTGVVRMRAFDTVVDAERLRLSRNETRRVRFSQRFDAAGTYTVGVGNRSRTVVVGSGGPPPTEAADERQTTADGAESASPVPVEWAVVALGAGAAVLFGLAALGRLVRRA